MGVAILVNFSVVCQGENPLMHTRGLTPPARAPLTYATDSANPPIKHQSLHRIALPISPISIIITPAPTWNDDRTPSSPNNGRMIDYRCMTHHRPAMTRNCPSTRCGNTHCTRCRNHRSSRCHTRTTNGWCSGFGGCRHHRCQYGFGMNCVNCCTHEQYGNG